MSNKREARTTNLIGSRSPTLIDGLLVAQISNKLGMHDSSKVFSNLEKRRLLPRSLQIITQVSTTAGLYFLSNNRFVEAGICGTISLLAYVASSYLININDKLLHTALKDLYQTIESNELGKPGINMQNALKDTIELSSEERRLPFRISEIDFWFIIQSLAVILGSPDSMIPILAGTATSFGITSLIEPIFTKNFKRKDAEFLEAESKLLRKRTSESEKEYQIKQKERAIATLPINLINKIISFGIYAATKGGINAGLLSAVVSQLTTGFTSKTGRLVEIENARNILERFYRSLAEVDEALTHKIRTDKHLEQHIEQSKETFPLDLEERLKELGINSAIIINAVLENLGTEPKLIKTVIPTDDIVVFHGDNGTGKSSLLRLIMQDNDLHDGSVGFFNNDELVNAHEVKKKGLLSFGHWKQHDFEITNGNFFELTGLTSFKEAQDYFEDTFLRENRITDPKIFELDLKKLLQTDIGMGETLSDGERKFVMLSAFIFNAIKQKKDYIFIDEIFAMLSNKENRLKKHLMLQLKYAQRKGVKVILTMQNKNDIPNGIDKKHIIKFTNDNLMHYPTSEFDVLAFDRLFVDRIYREKAIKDKDTDLIIKELIEAMIKSKDDEEIIQKVVGSVLFYEEPARFLKILRTTFQLQKISSISTLIDEIENFEMNWVKTIIHLAKISGLSTARFLEYIGYHYSSYGEFEELNQAYIPRRIYDTVTNFWNEALLE